MWDININALLTWQMMICLFIASDESEPTSPPLYALILTPTRELAIQTRDHIQAVTKYTNITVRLMPMTHLPEIGAKNACQKTDTINWHEKRAYPLFLPETVARKIQYQIACETCQKLVPVFWYCFFWFQFLVSMSWALFCFEVIDVI